MNVNCYINNKISKSILYDSMRETKDQTKCQPEDCDCQYQRNYRKLFNAFYLRTIFLIYADLSTDYPQSIHGRAGHIGTKALPALPYSQRISIILN